MIQSGMGENADLTKGPDRKTILVTNDDGVRSPGLMALFRAVRGLGDAYVVAPDRERSAVGHALTMHRPLRVEELGEVGFFSVNGTPTDCVAVGMQKLLPVKPALVVSGINRGANLGDDITYSGTVSAAIEGTIMGIQSFAVSLFLDPADGKVQHYETAGHYATLVASFVMENPLPYDTLLNVNVPNVPVGEVKGIRFTRQSKRIYDGAIHETRSPWGEIYYWIGGGKPFWEHGDDTDMNAVAGGYVSVTPIHLDLTNRAAIDWLKSKWPDGYGQK
ncbi:MAG: 5'/3'-nucleotidase SurE [Nitrospiraceae bacterium]|nr:5'/3'-nucleotidase SurE [Nitrospiraceae bacterium]